MTPITPDSLRQALVRAVAAHNYDGVELRDAVVQFAGESRLAGVPPERVLVAVKRVIEDDTVAGMSDWWRSIITDRFVRWAVEGYYRIDLGGPATTDRSVP